MYNLFELIWIFILAASATFVFATAALMVRDRRPQRWLVLAGALLFGGASILTAVFVTCNVMEWNWFEPWSRWLRNLGLINGAGQVTFLLGMFLHTLRRSGESARIAELEAIL